MVCLTTWLYYCLVILVVASSADVILLFCGNSKIRYYACYLSYIKNLTAIALSCLPLLPFVFIGSNINLIYFTTLPAQIHSKILGIKWETRGLEHLDKNRSAVVAATHQTIFDVLGLFILGSTLRNMVAVARKALFYVWPVGLIFWLSRTVVFIDNQTKGSNATRETLSNIFGRTKKEKMKIVFFPEGTRNLNGKTLLPFKKGAFKLAIESQLPIVPIVFSPYNFINPQKKTFQKGKVIISILPPIETEGTTILDLEKIKDKTQTIMEAEFQKLSSEVDTENRNKNLISSVTDNKSEQYHKHS